MNNRPEHRKTVRGANDEAPVSPASESFRKALAKVKEAYDKGDFAEAQAVCQQVLSLHPQNPDVLTLLGHIYAEQRDWNNAVELLSRAISIHPAHSDALFYLGRVMQKCTRHKDALLYYEKCIAANPRIPEAHHNRAFSLFYMNHTEEALKSCDKAIALNPGYADAYLNKSYFLLSLGRYEEGWKLYEWRWKANDLGRIATQISQKPLWLGDASIAGKTILLHAEQGFGDTIQFCRYVPMVAALGANVLLEVQKPLTGLVRTLKSSYTVIAQGNSLPAFDFHCPLMSLPLALGTSLATIPSQVPYLSTCGANRSKWQHRLGTYKKPRIGLVWATSGKHQNAQDEDRNRSIGLSTLAPLLRHNCEYHSLQKDIRLQDREILPSTPIISHNEHLDDFLDTASLASEMDFIISVDTSVAHLAGALGKPVWVLLSFFADFRWLRERQDSPWYPTARLFRQTALGDWDNVVSLVNDALISTVYTLTRTFDLLEQARTIYQNGALFQAEAAYRTILLDFPHHVEALTSLGSLLVQQNKQEEGIALMEEAIRLDAGYASAYYNYGLALQTQNRHSDAIAQYDKAVAMDSAYAEAYNNRGIALFILGCYGEAVANFERALVVNPDYADAARNLSLALPKLASE